MKTTAQAVRAVLVLAGVVFTGGAYAQTILKFSHTDLQTGARQAASLMFAKKVEEYTQGRYKVNVFCCAQLGNDPKGVEQLVSGGIDFTATGTSTYSPFIPGLNLACYRSCCKAMNRAGNGTTNQNGLSRSLTKGQQQVSGSSRTGNPDSEA